MGTLVSDIAITCIRGWMVARLMVVTINHVYTCPVTMLYT